MLTDNRSFYKILKTNLAATASTSTILSDKNMRIEEKFTDVLQNIEAAVAMLYRENPQMSDYAVMSAYEALIEWYSAEKVGRKPRNMNLSPLEDKLFDEITVMCEYRLGRAEVTSVDPNVEVELPTPITMGDLILCLKKLLKSARTWNKRGGRQGYLQFMSEFVC